jgi:hypothetical protein
MNNRLKLYDSTIYTYLEPKDKAKFRKIAFRHKKSISEFNRYLILLVIKLDEKKKLNKKNELTEEEITDVLNIIGRDIL